MTIFLEGALLTGCMAEVEQADTASDEAVLDHVEALGYDRDATTIHGEHVVVEGDLLLSRDELLRGAYENRRDQSDLVSKGYRTMDVIAPEHQGNIKLAFATGKHASSKAVRQGFIDAAAAWSAIPDSAIRISTTNTGPTITVHTIPAAKWRTDSPCKALEACGQAPVDGKPGRVIYVRSAPTVGDCTEWGGSNLINVTRHELGHTLGFEHPEGKESVWVRGTGLCEYDTEEDCDDDDERDYTTIMGSPAVNPGCVVTPARLTRDDYLTCAKVYPAR